jgi:hypothetical protein
MNSNLNLQPEDGIVAEVRRVKEALFDACGRDVHRMFEELRREQQTSDHPIIPRVGPIKQPHALAA